MWTEEGFSWDKLSKLPRDPGKYKSNYTLTFGSFYSLTGGNFESSREFTINKVNIYFSAYTGGDIEYVKDTSNIVDKVLKDYVYIKNLDISSSTSNMKVKFVNSTSATYNSSNGVYIFYKVYNSSGTEVSFSDFTSLTLGSYTIKMTMYINGSYNLFNYFESVNYGSSKINIGANYKTEGYPNSVNNALSTTGYYLSVSFKVSDVCSLNSGSFDSVIAGSTEINSIASCVSEFYIVNSSDTKVNTGLSSNPSNWKNYKFDGLSVGTYYFVFKTNVVDSSDTSGFQSGRIQFKITS